MSLIEQSTFRNLANKSHEDIVREQDQRAFEHWLRLVDSLLLKRIGLTHRDIADRPWRDMHDDMMRPFEVVTQIMSEGIDAL